MTGKGKSEIKEGERESGSRKKDVKEEMEEEEAKQDFLQFSRFCFYQRRPQNRSKRGDGNDQFKACTSSLRNRETAYLREKNT